MLGQDVFGEARGVAHPPGTASIPAGLQLFVFLSSGFYGTHTPGMLGPQLEECHSSPLAVWDVHELGVTWVPCWLRELVALSLLFPSRSWNAAFGKCISILSYVSASCKAGRLHETLVPTAESQLRVLVSAAYLICLNANSFSLEAQCSLFPISLLSYLLNSLQQIRTPWKQAHQFRNHSFVL